MKKVLSIIIALSLLFVSCSQTSEPESGIQSDTVEVRSYSHDERMELLDDTKLRFPRSFYDPDALERYFDTLHVIQAEYTSPGSVPDSAFAEFEAARDSLAVSYRGDYPVIVIDAPENLAKEYMTGSVSVIDDGEILSADVEIKVRGNSTADAPKKPYNIKFDEKVSLFGIEEGKKWSLLANMFDKTLIRNKLALDFGLNVGLNYTSQSEFCEVWVNGRFMGNYLCCEPVSDGANRVGIKTDEFDFILEITPFGGWSFKTRAGVPILYDSPDDPSVKQREYLDRLLEAAETAMKTGDPAEYGQYIDIESFVNLYILMELFKDVDGYWKSLYFYVEDGKLYAGPPWDFDLTCGNVSEVYEEENYFTYHNVRGRGDDSGDSTRGLRMDEGWWQILLDTDAFSGYVRERYNELQPLIVNIYEDNELGQNQIDRLIEANRESFEREYLPSDEGGAGWDIAECYSIYAGESKGSYEDNVEFLRDWLMRRNEWLLENIGK